MTPLEQRTFLSGKKHFLLLTGIEDDIYSTVNACKTANEMWIAIERLQQGESLNVQDVKTNLMVRFVTVVKVNQRNRHTSSYHTLVGLLKQYQTEVNDIRDDKNS
ncbi:hypothetical protein Tco_1041700 [Tanacetum coccineum]|uniref:UBN2 domain-containing protein n=1 Tax=Tanacetum coccineum TaxID=301880 RepID=A0ABQ5GGW0_9ASTR